MTQAAFPSPPSPGLRAWAEIDLAALRRNVAAIRASLPAGTRVIAVVKANAYGHGVQPVVNSVLTAGADMLAVANVREAIELRGSGVTCPILILGPLLPDEDSFITEHRLTVTLSSPDEVARWAAAARAAGATIPLHLKVDTGMGRTGRWHEEALELAAEARRHPELQLAGLYTHLASADNDPEFTRQQRHRLASLHAQLPEAGDPQFWFHADNSAGVETFDPEVGVNAVRPGLMLYGARPAPGPPPANLQVEPVLGFHACIGLIKNLPAGTGIGYNSTCHLPRASRIGIVTVGYADGVPRSVSNRGALLVHGRRCPILGRVSMDQTTIDLSGVPEAAVGDTATVIGRQGTDEITAVEFSNWAETNAWETFCRLSRRVVRVYLNARAT